MFEQSPRLCIERCDEDIDLLSELLDTNSNASTGTSFDVSEGLINNDMDELTSYLCRTKPPAGGNSKPLFPMLFEDSCTSPDNSTTASRSPVHSQHPDTTTDVETRPHSVNRGSILFTIPSVKTHPCMSRNAMSARENRLKKKQYVQQMEVDMKDLENENTELKVKVFSQDKTIEKLHEQVLYLQNVIANQSTLSALLKNIQNTSGVKLSSSWSMKEKPSEVGMSKSSSWKIRNENQENKSCSSGIKPKKSKPKSRREVTLRLKD